MQQPVVKTRDRLKILESKETQKICWKKNATLKIFIGWREDA